MILSRRSLLLGAGAVPLAHRALADLPAPAPPVDDTRLPFKEGFAASGITYLDAGSQHPLSLGAQAQAHRYLALRALEPQAAGFDRNEAGVLEKYARLVNADLDEVAFVQSTTTAEQMFLRALGIPESGGHIVTDTLHFFGSLPLYAEMEKRGMQVSWIRERDGLIPLEELRRAIRPDTRLVALSLVSTINGFEHDLKAVCELAHEVGALVYADIIHAVGCMPVDLHASGVDLAAGASYKWLMGEFGLGFLYVRRDVQPRLERVNFGYFGLSEFRSHIYPHDEPGDTIVDYAFREDATGSFALGTHAHTPIVILNHSLDYLLRVGVDRIQAHAQTLIARLKEELPERGYQVFTPPESRAPMVACALPNAREALGGRLKEAGVRLTLSRHRFRASVSVFNDMDDIERLLDVLGKA